MDQTTMTTAATATIAAPTTTTWTIDPSHSEVGFSIRHMMVSSTRGRFSDVRGDIVLAEDDPSRSSVAVEIGVASVDTREDKRDAHLRSADFFNVEVWPSITFRSTRVEPLGGEHFRVTGDLTIRDLTRPVTFEAEYHGRNRTPWGTEVIGFSADLKLNRKDFGLTYNIALETGGFVVGDEVKIHLDVEAGKQD